ncbi:DUF6268 family outer membrane beta-barrel protein [Flavobacterium psychrotrophum]|uniref:DUF6268 family outer membrane beta-barrel protein n=1 Tax=Flavobacterium psychrotrophum TaxID=2294119 RepID=UPI000E31C016|nr:DUF6268 family outer membrane beta-barrel protein [Flavobacterium psychrotrophum]
MLRYTLSLLLVALNGFAQETVNSLNYDYTSLYNAGATSLTRHEAGYNLQAGSFTYTAGIAAYTFDYDMADTNFSTNRIKDITTIKLGVAYTNAINTRWSAVANFTPQLTATLKNTEIKDIYPGFFAGIKYKNETGTTALTMGVGYQGYFGKFRFMPIINYSGQLSTKLAFNVGIPATWLAYKFNDAHVLKAVAYADSFYSRIETGSATQYETPTTIKISGLEMVTINTGLEYNYNAGKEWVGTFRTGSSVYNKLTIPGSGGYDLGFNKNIYISAGFKYNLNFK